MSLAVELALREQGIPILTSRSRPTLVNRPTAIPLRVWEQLQARAAVGEAKYKIRGVHTHTQQNVKVHALQEALDLIAYLLAVIEEDPVENEVFWRHVTVAAQLAEILTDDVLLDTPPDSRQEALFTLSPCSDGVSKRT